ncbi:MULTISPECIES: alanine--tRNA ligase [Sporosarcina]|uniref:alanine--tRNA ligase n=1 Tax=Sporosarcina TaxID=1569 RepID=UPI00129BA91B|nr:MULTISPECIES: alanine--tRNA ligase [Sporosarcina]GKV66765.1 alanine--tRNA ligase [Sporosarcina sp. NCCP-2331]GLB57052.1 alanine--tRNA ligase [Sporosarcina sp. NCCP-2378]
MKKLTASEIRQLFLDYFKEHGHNVEPSAALVPVDDPSLLWINSGVATLKKYFDGRVIPENPRIANAQKSIRTNDIENVGYTARHHTFFEMLGNFSIGDYFKEEAIIRAWDFLTNEQWIGFDPELLAVTIHPEDEEAYTIWKDRIGIPVERIIRLEGNFWDIGEGPSGPNSEIFYDRGASYGNDFSDPELYPGGENDRYLEIWNLVFSEFNHNPDHTYTPLPKKNIDTGMGLERMASVIQDVPTNFDTDLFLPIIEAVENVSGRKYGETAEADTAFKVIADHIRTVAFAIGDGALPSNEGRGYVLRRLLRRAVRFAKQLGIEKPFMYMLVPIVGDVMKDFYPEVNDKQAFIMKVVKNEEDRFHETLHDGMAILSTIIEKAKVSEVPLVSGSDAFKLYDTYGFPFELTEEFALEENVAVDRIGFDEEMAAQRNRARAARADTDSMHVQSGVLGDIHQPSEFIGYQQMQTDASIIVLLKDGQLISHASEGETVQVILNQTPFYAESGGQIADKGTLTNESFTAEIQDVQKAPNGQNLHTVYINSGEMNEGAAVMAKVNAYARSLTVKNHTATHLLHRALKDVLGEHVNQAGSYVGPDRLRFDFSHFGQVTKDELERIEYQVNEQIWASTPVQTSLAPIAEAKEMGAMALFGEKYGDIVRVVQVGDYSIELCGGCHVSNTAEINVFKILSEGGIGAGTRRIEAFTGGQAFKSFKDDQHTIEQVASAAKATPKNVVTKVESILAEFKDLQRENESLAAKMGNSQLADVMETARQVEDVTVISAHVEVKDNNGLRQLIDELKQKTAKGVIVLGTVTGGKVMLAAGVTNDLQNSGYHAGKIVSHVASLCDGKGGGRPDMAMAGAKDATKLDDALQSVYDYVKSV